MSKRDGGPAFDPREIDSYAWTGRRPIPKCADRKTLHWAIQIGPRQCCLRIGNYYTEPKSVWWAFGRKFAAPYHALAQGEQ